MSRPKEVIHTRYHGIVPGKAQYRPKTTKGGDDSGRERDKVGGRKDKGTGRGRGERERARASERAGETEREMRRGGDESKSMYA